MKEFFHSWVFKVLLALCIVMFAVEILDCLVIRLWGTNISVQDVMCAVDPTG